MSTALLGRSAADLEQWAVAQGQSAFRGRQLHDWLYAKGARDLNGITVLPKVWRAALQEQGVVVGRLQEQLRSVASDATTSVAHSLERSRIRVSVVQWVGARSVMLMIILLGSLPRHGVAWIVLLHVNTLRCSLAR